jgi:hypothetical protein
VRGVSVWAFEAALEHALVWFDAREAGARPVAAVDGHSAAGKSTFAARLAELVVLPLR